MEVVEILYYLNFKMVVQLEFNKTDFIHKLI